MINSFSYCFFSNIWKIGYHFPSIVFASFFVQIENGSSNDIHKKINREEIVNKSNYFLCVQLSISEKVYYNKY